MTHCRPAASASIHYLPAGYDPTYSVREVSAAQNLVTATLTHPVIADGYTGTALPTIPINGSTAASGYFATLD